MNLYQNIKSVFISKIGINIIEISGFIIFTNTLGLEIYGQFILFHGLSTVGSVVGGLGIDRAVEKRASELDSDRLLATALRIKFALAAIVAFAIYVFSNQIDSYVGSEIYILLILSLVIQMFSRLFIHSVRGIISPRTAAKINLIRQAVFLSLGLILIISTAIQRELYYSYILSWLAVLILGFYYLKPWRGKFDIKMIRPITSFSSYNFIAVVVGTTLFKWMDTLIIGIFLPYSFVTAYEAAWKISRTVLLLSDSVSTVVFPHVSEITANNRQSKRNIERAIPKTITISYILVPPSILGSLIIGGNVLETTFGKGASIASGALVVLLFGNIGESINDTVGHVLLGIDKPHLLARSTIIFTIINATGNAILIPTFGLIGASVATALSFFINPTMNYIYLSRLLTVDIPIKNIIQLSIISVSVVLPPIIIKHINTQFQFPSLILAVFASGILYGLLIQFYGPIEMRDVFKEQVE